MPAETDTALSTGMANLDAKFKQGGIVSGSVVSIQGSPTSLSDIITYNFANGRPTTYVTFGSLSKTTERALRDAGQLDEDLLSVTELSATASAQTFTEKIAKQNTSAQMTLIVDPVNYLERTTSEPELANALSTLKEVVEKTHSICVLHLLTPQEVPSNRWVTLSHSDTVFTALHDTSRETVRESFAIEKLHPFQTLHTDDTRVFLLSPSLDIDINTKQRMSP
jgi:hypothetical protein